MTAPDDGGPAFPVVQTQEHWVRDGNDQFQIIGLVESVGGMSLRDYFIAHAPITLDDAISAAQLETHSPDVTLARIRVMAQPAKRAVALAALAELRSEYANAMLAARKVRS